MSTYSLPGSHLLPAGSTGLRAGFEVSYFSYQPGGVRVEGTTAGLQDGKAWVVSYCLDLDSSWHTRRATIATRTTLGSDERLIESDGTGHWTVGGKRVHHLDGCLDLDLESSAMTNALPVHRLGLVPGESAVVPAAYVRVTGNVVERLNQRYERAGDQKSRQQYDYEAPAFDFRARLIYDTAGLVLDYPGIAVRAG